MSQVMSKAGWDDSDGQSADIRYSFGMDPDTALWTVINEYLCSDS